MATMKTLNGYGFNATELNGKTSDNYLLRTDTASDSAKLGGKSPEYYIQPRNLLDNSDFRNPVNQRGKTSYTGSGYTIDRWYINAGSCTIENGNGVIVSSPDDTKMTFMQHLENIDAEKVYTFAIKDSDGNVYLIQSTPGERIEENTSFGTIIAKMLSEDITFAITISAANSKKFIWAALYEGTYTADTLPPYVPKGYAAEQMACRWTYIPFIQNAFLGYALIDSDGINFQGFIPLPKMRVENPQIQGGLASWDGSTSIAVASITTVVWQGNGLRLNGALNSISTPKTTIALYAPTTGAFIADL